MDSDNFYMILPSNVKAPEYPDNSTSHFFTPIPQPLTLPLGKWEVALVNITYPYTWFNVDYPYNLFVCLSTTDDDTIIHENVIIPPGYYNSAQELITTFKELQPEWMKSTLATHAKTPSKFKIFLSPKEGLVMGKRMQQMLGFTHIPTEYNNSNDIVSYSSAFSADLNINLHAIYIYCDLVRDTLVGTNYVPLLRVINAEGKPHSHVEQSFYRPFYLEVKSSNINSIEISLCDDIGKHVRFEYGRVIIYLHFRRKRHPIF